MQTPSEKLESLALDIEALKLTVREAAEASTPRPRPSALDVLIGVVVITGGLLVAAGTATVVVVALRALWGLAWGS